MRSRAIDRLACPFEMFLRSPGRKWGPGMTVFDEPRTEATEPLTWHRAGRPAWDCLVCHQPWPCAPAKVELAEEFANDRVSGTIYLAMSLHDAINDSFHARDPNQLSCGIGSSAGTSPCD